MNKFWENLSDDILDTVSPIKYDNSKNIRIKAGVQKRRRKAVTVRVLLAAAAMAVISIACYAAIESWRLPPPRDIGDVPPVIELPEDKNENGDTAGDGNDADIDFVGIAEGILDTIGVDRDGLTPKITMEYATQYSRHQAKVSFGDINITLDAQDGTLISGELLRESSDEEPVSEDKSLAAAKEFYEKLPFAKGYVYNGVNPISPEYKLYSFIRTYDIEIDGSVTNFVNPYEEVRIAVNTVSGKVESWNSFYFPLLDDHKENDVPVSKEAAVLLASDRLGITDGYEISAEPEIVLPNYIYSDYQDESDGYKNYAYPSVSRLAWTVVFSKDNELFKDRKKVYVDLYTGQILGGDQMK